MNPAQAQILQDETQRLAACQPLDWSHLQGGRLLLTGCTGPFGWWLLQRLAHAQAHEGLQLRGVALLTRRAAAVQAWLSLLPSMACLELIEGDITQIDQRDIAFTHLVHGATTSAHETFGGASAISKFDTLVDGTRAVVRLCHRARPQAVLFLGSGVVYGPRPGPVEETDSHAPDTLDPGSGLAQAKRAAEFILGCAAQELGFSLTIARCFAFAGPGIPLDVHYALGNFVQQALQAPALVVQGDGRPLRSFLHLGDLAIWLWRMLAAAPGTPARVFNVGSDAALSIGELAQRVAAELSPHKPVQVLGQLSDRAKNIDRSVYLPSIAKARRELGLDAWTPLPTSIRLMGRYLQAFGPHTGDKS